MNYEGYIDDLKAEIKKLKIEIKSLKNEVLCPNCKGEKRLYYEPREASWTMCPVCNGTGKKYGD